jgi:hypothetical protein
VGGGLPHSASATGRLSTTTGSGALAPGGLAARVAKLGGGEDDRKGSALG